MVAYAAFPPCDTGVMSHEKLLGHRASLQIRRLAPAGAFLAVEPDDTSPDAATILLPRRELAEDSKPGDLLDVFVYLDSDDRPIATRRAPKLALDEVAFLEVKDTTQYGAFVDWGMPKDLVVP